MSSLIDELKAIPDFRKARGQSHPLWVLLLLNIMAILAGYRGYRPCQTFVEEHYLALCELLQFKIKKVPSHSTFRRIMMGLDYQQLTNCFEQWMLSQSELTSAENRVSAIDGKRICQAVVDDNGKERFVGLVSLFAVEMGITQKLQALTQQDNSELKVVQSLLESLKLEGLIITMDALHAQKNTQACAGFGQ